MSSSASVASSPSIGLLGSLRQLGVVLAAKVRQLASVARAYIASTLAIPPSTVLPLALVALVIVYLVLARRA